MGLTRALPVALVTALLAFSSGCSSTGESGLQHGDRAAQGPFCSHRSFGEVKAGELEKVVSAKASEPDTLATEDHPSDAGKVLVLSHPLDALPPEIARIRRGLVKRFTGRFIKDGQVSWSGLDLDRLVAVSVERRVFDIRAHQSRPVPDPVFGQPEQLSFARKWSDGNRTEVEVIDVFPIMLVEAQLFVCAANPAWANKKPLPDEEDPSGQMSAGVTDVFLLDYRQQQGVSYRYSKPIEMTEKLASILAAIWQHAPQGPAW